MGYSTHYHLETSDGDRGSHMQAIGQLSGYGDTLWQEGWKWYEHEDHMLQYSLRHPGVTFYLRGYGDEATDIWAKWFKNGKSQEWRLDPDIPGIDDLPSPWPSETPGTSSAG